jgi:hypothetical protein
LLLGCRHVSLTSQIGPLFFNIGPAASSFTVSAGLSRWRAVVVLARDSW